MSKIESKIGRIKGVNTKIYSFLADFNNFGDLIPHDKVKDWKSDGESCSFKIDGLGSAGLRFVEKEEHKLLKISSDGNTPISFQMWIQLKALEEEQTAIKITIEPMINALMFGMVKSPLQEFADMLIDRLETMKFGESEA